MSVKEVSNMNDQQRLKIKVLRYQGVGYKKIGLDVGLSRDIVRGYCKRNGLEGYGTELVKEYEKIMKEDFVHILCLNCGVEIVQNKIGAKRKYCSTNCKREWDNNHRKEYEMVCEYCGENYKALGGKKRKFCSHNCYTDDSFNGIQLVPSGDFSFDCCNCPYTGWLFPYRT